MSKNNELKENVTPEVPPMDELSLLRKIVFGVAEEKLIEKITHARADTEQSITALEQLLKDKTTELHKKIDLKFAEIDNKLSLIDKAHDENEEDLVKSLESLSSEHEMFVSETQQDFKAITESLDHESTNLAQTFDQQLHELKAHLDKVSNELSSSKTDRKTLAKLLATMATNLEDDLS